MQPGLGRAAIGLVAAAAAAGAATAGVEYQLVIIEPWNTSYPLAISSAAGINNVNQVSGCATPVSGGCAFLWTLATGKVPIELAGAMNDEGVIAGSGAIRWPDGTIEFLDSMSSPQDINNANVVAGATGVGCMGGDGAATVWDEANGTRFLDALGVPAADEAYAINEHGQVVGVRSTTGLCGDFEAFYFDLQTLEHVDLHALLVGGASGITEAFDVNDEGVVIGQGPAGGTVRPFLWSLDGGFTFLPAIPGGVPMHTHPRSINNRGDVVGAGITGDEWHAFIWSEARGMRDLNALVDAPPDFLIDTARKINENGWIIGSGHTGVWSPERAVVLVPIAVPGDLDGDGTVGMADLLALLGAWGPCGGCPEDLDGDGAVGVTDLLALLAGWG